MHGARVRKERLRARRLPRGARVRGNPQTALNVKKLLALAELQSCRSSVIALSLDFFACLYIVGVYGDVVVYIILSCSSQVGLINLIFSINYTIKL